MPNRIDLDTVWYRLAGQEILRGVSLSIERNQAHIIVGRSGSGKSLLLELCAGLRRPAAGKVCWDGEDIAGFAPEKLLLQRRRAGFVFQQHALIHNYSLYDNLALPLRYHTDLDEDRIGARIKPVVERFGLNGLEHLLPEALSTGQARCASIARALIAQPDLLFLDEPTAGLDPLAAEAIIEMLVQLRGQATTALLIISHNPCIMNRMACPVSILRDGVLRGQSDLPDKPGISDIQEILRG